MAANNILLVLCQARATGRLDTEGANSLLEFSPRLVDMLCSGLSGKFGDVTRAKFRELADAGKLTADVLEMAMS